MRQAFSHRLSGMIIIDRIIKPCSRIYFLFVGAKLYKYFQLILMLLFFFAALVAVFLVADAAGVREVADIRAYANDTTDGFHGEHKAGVCEFYAAGVLFREQAEKCGLCRYVPAAIARAETVGALES